MPDMMLAEQIRELAIRRVNEAWFRVVHVPGAVRALLALAFVENWDRTSYDARVILKAEALMNKGLDVSSEPGVVP